MDTAMTAYLFAGMKDGAGGGGGQPRRRKVQRRPEAGGRRRISNMAGVPIARTGVLASMSKIVSVLALAIAGQAFAQPAGRVLSGYPPEVNSEYASWASTVKAVGFTADGQ